jgi:hypothetical protein
MRLSVRFVVLGSLIAASAGAPIYAHHSPAAFDQGKEIRIAGTVSKFAYNNPHIYLTIDTVGSDGRTVSQEVEAAPISVVRPLGLEQDSLQVGDRVTVRAVPRRRGSGTVMGIDVTRADGLVLPLQHTAASVRAASNALASSIAGTWRPQAAGFTALNRAVSSWPTTERGRVELAAARSSNFTTHSDCIPAGAPMLMVYPVASSIKIEAGAVLFDIDWLGAQRVVHVDASHPASLEPSLHGHSIGRWEGDTLVVDTVGFAPHAEGIGFGMPSSASKYLIERFTLEPDRKHLRYEAVIEDPVYLVEPLRHAALWEYSPSLRFSEAPCDLDVARQYLLEDRAQ